MRWRIGVGYGRHKPVQEVCASHGPRSNKPMPRRIGSKRFWLRFSYFYVYCVARWVLAIDPVSSVLCTYITFFSARFLTVYYGVFKLGRKERGGSQTYIRSLATHFSLIGFAISKMILAYTLLIIVKGEATTQCSTFYTL